MMKKILLSVSLLSVLHFVSCSSDDNSDSGSLTIEEQNMADDQAIEFFLNNYYFDGLGKVRKYSDMVTPEDKPALSTYAKKDPSGFWVVKNPEAAAGSGSHPDGNNNILVHYDLKYFTASAGGAGYTSLETAISTINGFGRPQENPSFYKKPANATQADSYYLVPSLINGLKEFLPTNKTEEEIYDKLQGVIIVPSRLAYARNSNWLNLTNATLVFNFELYQVNN